MPGHLGVANKWACMILSFSWLLYSQYTSLQLSTATVIQSCIEGEYACICDDKISMLKISWGMLTHDNILTSHKNLLHEYFPIYGMQLCIM